MKFRLTLSKSITIDTDEHKADGPTIGEAWAEQILESLRADSPEAQIDTCSVEEQTGAIISTIEDDVSMTIDDFAIETTDIKVEILDDKGEPK